MIYLDHHSTTTVLPEAWEAMRPWTGDLVGNPSSAHAHGRRARQALDDARQRIAQLLDAHPDEVLFTSGATEANNLAVLGIAGTGHVIASPIEHPCIIEPLRHLQSRGNIIDWLPVSRDGGADIAGLMPQPETRLACLMLVNHETGAVQPVADAVARLGKVPLHVDAAQAVGKRPVRFHELGAASLSASGHKFGAPAGIGLLLVRRGLTLAPQFYGGHQQHGQRPGTEPVALAAAFATALEIRLRNWQSNEAHVRTLWQLLLDELPGEVRVSPIDGSPYVLNIAFPGCRADLLLMKLDLAGVACSTGSACSSGSLLPSPVLQAAGWPDDVLRSALRFSFSPSTTPDAVREAAAHVRRCVAELRQNPV